MRRAREVVGPEVMAKAPGWHDAAKAMNARYEAPTEPDAVWADAIAFGSPTRVGGIAAELKSYIDSLGALWYEGKLVGKSGNRVHVDGDSPWRQRNVDPLILPANGASRHDHRSAWLY